MGVSGLIPQKDLPAGPDRGHEADNAAQAAKRARWDKLMSAPGLWLAALFWRAV